MSEKIIIESELLWSLYYGNNYSTRDLARLFNCGQTTIRRKLNKYSIPSKSLNDSEWREEVNYRMSIGESQYKIEPDLLLALYWGNEYSLDNIAEIFECSQCVIRNRMNRYNIPCRTISEARKGNVYENAYKFPKEYIPWNKNKVGVMPIPWNKGTKGIMIGYWTGKKRPNMSGENNPRWNGGITSENRQIRHSIKYKRWRKLVYKKDKWTCQVCGIHCDRYSIIAHHIKSFGNYPEERFDVDNGITLCRSCHAWIHNCNGLKKS